MRLGRRSFLGSAVASAAAPSLLRLARADAPQFTLKLHHAFSSVSCVHANFLSPWARDIEAQSQGRIRINIFPSMQLGGQPADLFDQAHYGAADIVWAMPSRTPGRFPRIELFELPFVPSRRALVSTRALQDFSAQYLKDEFRDVHPICFSCADRGVVHAVRPIENMAAMKGLRLDVRTRFAAAAVETLYARSVPVPSAQLPLAISRRVVDGCVIPWHMVPALKLDDLLKAHTDFADYSLSTTTYVLAMNRSAYERLPPDLQKVFDDNSGQSAAGMAGAMWDLQAKAVAASVAEHGGSIVTLQPDSVAQWRAATAPVIEAWIKVVKTRRIEGDKLLASVRALLDKYVNEPEPQPAAEASAGTSEPAKADGAPSSPVSSVAPAENGVTAAPPKVSVATPPPDSAPTTHWWQFWKTASPAPAAASVPPPASAMSAVPATSPPVAAVVKPAPVAPPTKALNIPM